MDPDRSLNDDLTYEAAEKAAVDRIAEELGARSDTDEAAVSALSDQLVFLRTHPIRTEEEVNNLTLIHAWGCDDEARIALGRLATRGWKLVRA